MRRARKNSNPSSSGTEIVTMTWLSPGLSAGTSSLTMTAGKYLPEPGRPGRDARTMTEWISAGYRVAGSWAAGSRLMTASNLNCLNAVSGSWGDRMAGCPGRLAAGGSGIGCRLAE
jgi:hypothetical protein